MPGVSSVYGDQAHYISPLDFLRSHLGWKVWLKLESTAVTTANPSGNQSFMVAWTVGFLLLVLAGLLAPGDLLRLALLLALAGVLVRHLLSQVVEPEPYVADRWSGPRGRAEAVKRNIVWAS